MNCLNSCSVVLLGLHFRFVRPGFVDEILDSLPVILQSVRFVFPIAQSIALAIVELTQESWPNLMR